MLVSINEIKIPWYFTQTPPGKIKLNNHIEYFNEHNDFLHPIILSKSSLRLVDGYCDYLVAVQKGISEIDCQVENIKRGKNSISSMNSKRKRIMRKELLAKYDGKCACCERALQTDNPFDKETYATIDHIIPLSKLGYNHISNMQLLCKRCNELKADLLPDEFENIYGRKLVLG